MTVDELIKALQDARAECGGDAQVMRDSTSHTFFVTDVRCEKLTQDSQDKLGCEFACYLEMTQFHCCKEID